MARIGSIVLHVADLDRAAQFWTGALGYVRRNGLTGDESPVLVPRDGQGPAITLDEDDRTHLDLVTDDAEQQEAEVSRLVALGAERVPWVYSAGATHVVLADPEGNLFCVVRDSNDR